MFRNTCIPLGLCVGAFMCMEVKRTGVAAAAAAAAVVAVVVALVGKPTAKAARSRSNRKLQTQQGTTTKHQHTALRDPTWPVYSAPMHYFVLHPCVKFLGS